MGETAEVGHERVIAETCPPLGHEDVGVTGRGELGDYVLHVPRGEELALFDVDGLAGLGGGYEEIGLTAEEGGNLEDVNRFGDGGALFRKVNVRGDGEAVPFADLGENGKGFGEAHAAHGRSAGAIGFIEG